MTTINHRVTLARRPTGEATADCFALESEQLAKLEAGQVRVKVEYISIDAALRTMLYGEGYHRQFGVGDTIGSTGVGRVIDSASPEWEVGQAVRGRLGAQTFATVGPKDIAAVDENLGPLSAHLGALGGTTGLTAWIGVRNIGKPLPGETFVVSGAAGGVGSIAGQIAKIDGARVIGIAGGPEKSNLFGRYARLRRGHRLQTRRCWRATPRVGS